MFRILLAFLILNCSSVFAAGPIISHQEIARDVGRDLESGKALERSEKALDALMIVAVKTLEKHGYIRQAKELKRDWSAEKSFILSKGFGEWVKVGAQGFGDHARIEWLYTIWEKIDGLVGAQVMEMAHLDDLYIFAYGIPVCLWCVDAVDVPEYAVHFYEYKEGFAGATTYWSAQIACSVATFGTGIGLICGPVATLAEKFMVGFVAPGLSSRMYKLVCEEQKY